MKINDAIKALSGVQEAHQNDPLMLFNWSKGQEENIGAIGKDQINGWEGPTIRHDVYGLTIKEMLNYLESLPLSIRQQPLMVFNVATGKPEEAKAISPFDDEKPLSDDNRLSISYADED